jgi:hypothetical protein
LAFLALLAFDGGLICWLATFMFGAQGGAQRAISLLMICVSLLGIVLGFGGDTLMVASQNGMIEDANIGMTALILTTLIIAANIAAVTFYHVLSPENQKRMAEESARSEIEDAALGSIKSQAKQLSQELAPIVAAAWVADMRAHYLAQLTPEAQRKALPPAGSTTTRSAKNSVSQYDLPDDWGKETADDEGDDPALTVGDMASMSPEQFAALAAMLQQWQAVNVPAEAAHSSNGNGHNPKG